MRKFSTIARMRVHSLAISRRHDGLFLGLLAGLAMLWLIAWIATAGHLRQLAANESTHDQAQQPSLVTCEPARPNVPGALLRCIEAPTDRTHRI